MRGIKSLALEATFVKATVFCEESWGSPLVRHPGKT